MTKEEFDQLYNSHLRNLIGYLMRYGKVSLDDAYDIAQISAINAYKYLVVNKKVINYTFKTFLYTCARNELVDQVRRHKVKNKQEINYSSFINNISNEDMQVEDLLKQDSKDTTSEEVCSSYIKEKIQEYIMSYEKTHPEYFSAFTLYSLENKSYKECAEILNIPIGTVKSRIFKAKSLLKSNWPETLDQCILSK